MTDLIRYNPFKEVRKLLEGKEIDFFRDIDSVFDNFTGKSFNVDILEEDDKYLVKAEMPGITKDDISVDMSPEGYLTISYSKEEKSEINGRYFRKEIRSGSYKRQFGFEPSEIKVDEINAEYNDGVLNISIPKVEKQVKQESKKIEIK